MRTLAGTGGKPGNPGVPGQPLQAEGHLEELVVLVLESAENGLSKVLVDLAVTRNGLKLAGLFVGIPVVFAAMTDQNATELPELLN